MAGIYDERCCEMLKLQTGERDHPANCWRWVANSVAFAQILPELKALHKNRVLLIKVLKDHESLKIGVKTCGRVEKI